MKKRALIVGGFKKAAYLAEFLRDKGYRVVIINSDSEDTEKLAQLTGLQVVCGGGSLPEVLKESGMQNAQLSIALTPKDEDNFVASVLCKRLLCIEKTVSVFKDAGKLEFFRKIGIDSPICETASVINALEQQDFLGGIASLIPISGGRVNVVEVPINEASPVAGKKLWEIELPNDVIVGCVLRKERSIVPRGDTRILSGDTLILIASDKHEVLAVRTLTGHDISR